MIHKRIPPKTGVHPTQYVELCPIDEGVLIERFDLKTKIKYKHCQSCGYISSPANLYPATFESATELKK